jgi:probable phosphoglycerate mutase
MERNDANLEIIIYLVRHGETDWNLNHRFQGRSDVPLNETGRKQANALALMLKNDPINAIYASPLIRALETARLIKTFHPQIPIIEQEGIIEMDLGEFEGMEGKTWFEKYPDFIKLWRDRPSDVVMPGGESIKSVQSRAVKTLNQILDLHSLGSAILICSHNFVILSLLCHIMNVSLDKFRDLKQETGSMSIVHKNADKMYVKEMNIRPLK